MSAYSRSAWTGRATTPSTAALRPSGPPCGSASPRRTPTSTSRSLSPDCSCERCSSAQREGLTGRSATYTRPNCQKSARVGSEPDRRPVLHWSECRAPPSSESLRSPASCGGSRASSFPLVKPTGRTRPGFSRCARYLPRVARRVVRALWREEVSRRRTRLRTASAHTDVPKSLVRLASRSDPSRRAHFGTSVCRSDRPLLAPCVRAQRHVIAARCARRPRSPGVQGPLRP